MKLTGGPWNGIDRDPPPDVDTRWTDQLGEWWDLPSRLHIGDRWQSVSHFYEVVSDTEARYSHSSFQWKARMEAYPTGASSEDT